MKRGKHFIFVVAVLLCLRASGQNYAIDWQVIASGGTSTGGIYSVSATIGEPAAGSMSGGDYTMDGGFSSGLSDPTELIVNGSFENTGGTFLADGNGVMTLPTGSTAIPGWTTTTAELVWVNNTNTFGAGTPFGSFSLDLTGYHDAPPYGGIMQTISTVPGQNYRLSLALGSNADYPGAAGQKSVSVNAGSASTTFTFTPTNTTGNSWQSFSFPFTATSTVSVVTIGGLVASGIYLGLDNVSIAPLTAAPPELRVAALRLGNNLRLSFVSVTGRAYAIQSLPNLESSNWTTLPGSTNTGDGGTLAFTVTNAFGAPRQFYRVQQLP